MGDLTILYYSANQITERFADVVRTDLLRSTARRFPIISVTHQPVNFGDERIVVGEIEPSVAQVYLNILEGCFRATTPFCACAEDDTLYSEGHWTYRPALDTFAYNEHRWVLSRRLSPNMRRREAFFYARARTQMAMGIFPRQLMIDTLAEKFAAYPGPPLPTSEAKKAGWGEPGRYEKLLGLTPRKLERFKWSEEPNVTVNHSHSLMGRRLVQASDQIAQDVPPWGDADALWRRIHG